MDNDVIRGILSGAMAGTAFGIFCGLAVGYMLGLDTHLPKKNPPTPGAPCDDR